MEHFFGLIFIPIFGLNYEYVFLNDVKCKWVLKVFDFKIYHREKDFIFPEYIGVVHQSYVDAVHFSWYMLGSSYNAKFKRYVIKFFNGKQRQTVFKTSNKEKVINKANDLSVLLNVRMLNTLNR